MKLTLPQQDVFFEQLLYPNDPIYNIGAKIVINGEIDYKTLNQAYIALIDQHDAYRSLVVTDSDQVAVNILPNHNSVLGFVDFSNSNKAQEKAIDFIHTSFSKVFDLNQKKLLHRFVLIKVKDDFYYLFSMYHHIITDGWGTSLMFQRLVSNYNELLKHGKIITEYPFSYLDFVEDDMAYSESESYQKDRIYWKERFKDLPNPIFTRLDNSRVINKSGRKELIIKRPIYDKLKEIAANLNSSSFHVIIGILYLYLGRRFQANDFAVGLPVLNRRSSVFKKTVGLFMGISALRINLDYEETFESLVHRIRKQLRQDYRYQRFPLGKLIKELSLYNEKDRLFNITVSYEKQDYADHFANTETQVIPLTHESERVALALYIREFDDTEDVKFDFDYNFNYFTEFDIQQVVSHIETLVDEVINDPKRKISDYDYIGIEERNTLLNKFNCNPFLYPNDKTILDYLEDAVQLNPKKRALFDENNTYTYEELDKFTSYVAKVIGERGHIDDDAPIAVLMDRSAHLVIILLGILRAGRFYIPLDPSFPAKRLNYILDHSKADYVVVGNTKQLELNSNVNFLVFDELVGIQLSKDDFKNFKNPKSIDTAYVIYTSGSTGDPKGVEIGHKSLLNFLVSMCNKPGMGPNDLLYSVTTQSFDISMLEFFVPLIIGATVYIESPENLKNPRKILDKLLEIQPTVIQATPSFYQMLFNAGWMGNKNLRVLCGGDILGKALAKKLIDNCKELWNMYGPTETTIWSTLKKVETPEEATVIGVPIYNTSIYVLDYAKKLLPIGSIGNIYIGGIGLAKGYYKDDWLTTEKFTNSFFLDKQCIIYDTGDIGKWNENGEIQFLGRSDYQVKIRGYRVELGDIESKLNKLNPIKSSVVIAKKNNKQEAVLLAYVLADGKELETPKIVDELRKELPEYMVPKKIIVLDRFPLTLNGKIDRKTLGALKISNASKPKDSQVVKNKTQKKLSSYFKEVLDLNEEVTLYDNFFELGGHSLNAIKLIYKIEKNLFYQLVLKEIFDYPTVADLSQYLLKNKLKEAIPLKSAPSLPNYPLTPSQKQIWLASQDSFKSISYNMTAAYHVKGSLKINALETAFKKLILNHLTLRTNFIELAGVPYMIIKPYEEVNFKITIEKTKLKHKDKLMIDYVNYEFDLRNDVMIKVILLEFEEGGKILIFSTHHIIMDGWSLQTMVKELSECYNHLIDNQHSGLEKPDINFMDYVLWHQKLMKVNRNKNIAYWESYLKGYQWKPLSFGKAMNDGNKRELGKHKFYWDSNFLNLLNTVSRTLNISLNALLVSALSTTLCKMTDRNDICLGIVTSGRVRRQIRSLLGMFAKTLPFRFRFDSSSIVGELFKQSHSELLELDVFQDIPEMILESLRLDTLFVFQTEDFGYDSVEMDNSLSLEILPEFNIYSRLPLIINITHSENRVVGNINFNTSVFDLESIMIMVLKLEKLLKMLVENTSSYIQSIDIELELSDFEKVDS